MEHRCRVSVHARHLDTPADEGDVLWSIEDVAVVVDEMEILAWSGPASDRVVPALGADREPGIAGLGRIAAHLDRRLALVVDGHRAHRERIEHGVATLQEQ